MKLSCCAWALPCPSYDIAHQVVGLGFQQVDLRPFTCAGQQARTQLATAGLTVSCVAASYGVHEDLSLESTDAEVVDAALRQLEISFRYAAYLGAAMAYLVPGSGEVRDHSRYAANFAEAADLAGKYGLKLAVEHFPGRAIPTVAATLAFLDSIDHPNLYILFDLGHAQMSQEDPVAAIESAGSRLGYVHLDDNNGVDDSHLALLDGVMTESSLKRTLQALDPVGYTGPVSLELNPTLPDPVDALRRSKAIIGNLFEIK